VTVRDPAPVSDDRLRVRAALLEVPPRQRAALVLRYYLGLTQEETATVLGCSTGTAKSQVSRGLGRLRDLLTAEQIELSDVEVWNSAHA